MEKGRNEDAQSGASIWIFTKVLKAQIFISISWMMYIYQSKKNNNKKKKPKQHI